MAATDLVSLAELNHSLQETADSGDQDTRKGLIITRVSAGVETFLDRHLVTATYTEYHSPSGDQQELVLGEWPVTSVTSAYEDSSWESEATADRYPATGLLVANTDYLARMPTREPAPYGSLYRIGGGWTSGRRVVRVIYVAGYANTAAVPAAIKDVCLDWCRALWWEESRKGSGMTSVSDASGSVSRFAPTILTQARQAALLSYKRLDYAGTWERDAT